MGALVVLGELALINSGVTLSTGALPLSERTPRRSSSGSTAPSVIARPLLLGSLRGAPTRLTEPSSSTSPGH